VRPAAAQQKVTLGGAAMASAPLETPREFPEPLAAAVFFTVILVIGSLVIAAFGLIGVLRQWPTYTINSQEVARAEYLRGTLPLTAGYIVYALAGAAYLYSTARRRQWSRPLLLVNLGVVLAFMNYVWFHTPDRDPAGTATLVTFTLASLSGMAWYLYRQKRVLEYYSSLRSSVSRPRAA
jgi:hypothetical protein